MSSSATPEEPSTAHVQEEAEPKRSLSAAYLDVLLKRIAEQFSDLRRLRKLKQEQLDYLRRLPYTFEEMKEDWNDACTYVALMILQGKEISFLDLEPTSYWVLQDVWFKTAKQLLAHYQWQREDQGNSVANYYKATGDLRQILLGRRPAALKQFDRVKNYLHEKYLNAAGSLDQTKPRTVALLEGKAWRIWETTSNKDASANWFRARTYAHLYYDNIVQAITQRDRDATASILKSFQYSKAPANRYIIIDCFEVAVASQFLDKEVVFSVLREPGSFAFSMVPVDHWPPDRKSLGKGCKVQYQPDEHHLVCEGVMTLDERNDLLSLLPDPQHRQAIYGLYEQSQLGPWETMVL
jgi:hypothetical protein